MQNDFKSTALSTAEQVTITRATLSGISLCRKAAIREWKSQNPIMRFLTKRFVQVYVDALDKGAMGVEQLQSEISDSELKGKGHVH